LLRAQSAQAIGVSSGRILHGVSVGSRLASMRG
jgi:hypothetical protein